MGIVRENLDFIRGVDPRQSISLGKPELFKRFAEDMEKEFPNLFLQVNWRITEKGIPLFQEKNKVFLNVIPKKKERNELINWVEQNYPRFQIKGFKYESLNGLTMMGTMKFNFI